MTRREWFRRTLGALVGSQLPLPVPKLAVPAIATPIEELNRVTLALLPALTDNIFRQTPMLTFLRSRQPQTFSAIKYDGVPIVADPHGLTAWIDEYTEDEA